MTEFTRNYLELTDRRGVRWESSLSIGTQFDHPVWESERGEKCGTSELNNNYGPFVGVLFDKR